MKDMFEEVQIDPWLSGINSSNIHISGWATVQYEIDYNGYFSKLFNILYHNLICNITEQRHLVSTTVPIRLINSNVVRENKEMCKLISKLSNKFKFIIRGNFHCNNTNHYYLTMKDDILLSIGHYESRFGASIYYLNNESNSSLINEIIEYIESYNISLFIKDAPSPSFYMMIPDRVGGVDIIKIGEMNDSLNIKNYSTNIANNIGSIKSSLIAKDPFGRIVILQGPPGTGKTHFIRGLIHEINNEAIPILLPIANIDLLNSPRVLKDLIDFKNQVLSTKGMIIIVEDGDIAVSKRMHSESTLISAILNMSEGIFGQMIDLKFVITTNTEITEFDDAIMRPGRLLKLMKFSALTYDEAQEAYWELCKDNTKNLPKEKEYKLCDIYKYHHQSNEKDELPSKRKIGF